MAEGTTAIDTALSTEGDADGSDLIEFELGNLVLGLGDDSPSPDGLDSIREAVATSTGALQYVPDHEELAARKLAPPFWGKPFIAALLASFTREIQALEDTVWEILEARTLPLADLPRLKVLGKIVGQPRLSFDTENYRLLIRARGLANVSRGRASDVFAILELLLGAGKYVLLEIGNATLLLTALQPVDAVGLAMVSEIMPDARAAGVGLEFLFSPEPFVDTFVWGDTWDGSELWGSVRIL